MTLRNDFRSFYANEDMTDLYGHFAGYPHRVEIDVTYKNLGDALIIERWGEEYFGEIEEYDPDCRWQVSYKTVDVLSGGQHRLEKRLIFYFHREDDAMAFKLAWS